MNAATRRPRGYVGTGHETVGSDILAVFGVVSMPQQTLGDALYARIRDVQPTGWYPIGVLIELMARLEAGVGNNGLRQMGRKLFEISHQEHVKQVATSAADIVYGFNDLYLRANRGEDIGGWKVLSFGRGVARLEKTTPHHCALEEGIVAAALNCVGTPATVVQEKCFRKGDDCCVFGVSSFVADARWGDARERLF